MRKEHAPIEVFLAAASRDTVPAFKPGTQLSYQSMGTAVVADIIQRITKLPLAEFLKKEMFDPIGLKSIGLGSKGSTATGSSCDAAGLHDRHGLPTGTASIGRNSGRRGAGCSARRRISQ